jgi:hypothetical protein
VRSDLEKKTSLPSLGISKKTADIARHEEETMVKERIVVAAHSKIPLDDAIGYFTLDRVVFYI